MPGFGIVAAVLGIVITMASIGGAVERHTANARRGGARRHLSGHSDGLMVSHGAAGDQHGIHSASRNWIYPQMVLPPVSPALPTAWRP